MIPQHEILEAAKEAGLDNWWDSGSEDKDTFNEIQIRFAAIIERKTIEKCAAHFEAQPHMEHFGDDIAAAIRKLGDE